MQEKSYRLAQYEIILDTNGGVWWKSHGGFAETKSGRCFIEGNILFLCPGEETEPGFLKNEWLERLKHFPQWDKTGYYCPSYTIHACEGERIRERKKNPEMAKPSRFSRAEATNDHSPRHFGLGSSGEGKVQQGPDSLSSVTESVEKDGESEPMPTESLSMKFTGGIGLASRVAAAGIEQVKGKLGKTFLRYKGLIRHNSKEDGKDDSEE